MRTPGRPRVRARRQPGPRTRSRGSSPVSARRIQPSGRPLPTGSACTVREPVARRWWPRCATARQPWPLPPPGRSAGVRTPATQLRWPPRSSTPTPGCAGPRPTRSEIRRIEPRCSRCSRGRGTRTGRSAPRWPRPWGAWRTRGACPRSWRSPRTGPRGCGVPRSRRWPGSRMRARWRWPGPRSPTPCRKSGRPRWACWHRTRTHGRCSPWPRRSGMPSLGIRAEAARARASRGTPGRSCSLPGGEGRGARGPGGRRRGARGAGAGRERTARPARGLAGHGGRGPATAAEALRGYPRDEAAARQLAALMKDQDRTVRRAAAESLEHLESAEARAALRAALGDSDTEVRRAAARGLGRN